jgi:lipopolysaccharide biosynthesis protein
VFAHYDPEGVLDEYVVRLLAGLREVCSKLVFAIRKRLESRTPSLVLAGSDENFALRSRANFQNRRLHHHVFDMQLIHRLFDHMGLETIFSTTAKPYHLIAVGRKYPRR